ncbi:lysophospholipid acyltransferase family protein [Fulvivirga kasyanovii]|uniref:Lipid A biosynthesis acyltransferase n=1 Tax=Fulvivirga kasyanovii TaxID=396812 RepID=A0ABW9RLF6_9BACT|nr:lysophospholipid acyltransferase family protein [Fulvivirga kasyanovii]MTI24521.1 lipid A biosynthesis acyltransferase [Fulvivirga kasyanovii]
MKRLIIRVMFEGFYSGKTVPMHNYLVYYLIIIPLSYLPFPVLYLLSDFIYIMVYYVFGYRRKVVFSNLKASFPNKTDKELHQIERKFYSHMADLVVESLKTFTISREAAAKRMVARNPEVPNQFYERGQSISMVGGHYGNWELYAVTLKEHLKHKVIALFTPMTNEFFNKKFKASRSRYGLNMCSIQEIKEDLENNNREVSATIFGSDQCPRKAQRAYWTEFLNQDTGVQFGLEKFARDNNQPVVYGNIFKVKRGYYEVEYKLICEDPSTMSHGEITEIHVKMLEDIINAQPEYWLWSHKRWKHKRPEKLEQGQYSSL